MKLEQKRIALVENCGLDFYRYRVPLALFLMDKGFDVFALIPDEEYTELIKKAGIKTLPYKLERNKLNVFSLYKSVQQLRNYNKTYHFDIVHSFRLQPNVICSLAFYLVKNPKIINHITGLGYSFTSSSPRALFYRVITYLLYQLLFLGTNRIITQNNNDKKVLSRLIGISKKFNIIEGSGIDHITFSKDNADQTIVKNIINELTLTPGDIIITFVGRILKEKGIREFIEAAKVILKKYHNTRFFIVGWLDNGNPSCLKESEMMDITRSNKIHYLGRRLEIKELLYLSHIFVLPTYREGFPRSTLEAMCLQLPVITTDVPGARETVINNFNGIKIKPKNSADLIIALEKLINDPEKRNQMGANGRMLVEKHFSADIIFNKLLEVYYGLLN